jgi:maleate cis-trans isomerase
MTPFDEPLNKLIRDFLAAAGIEAVSAPSTFRHPSEARKLTSGDVESMTKEQLAANPDVDAIYFQGAVLDPVEILEKMETELKIPIVASNPAMLWAILSKLGLKYQIKGYGKLLSSWPAMPKTE